MTEITYKEESYAIVGACFEVYNEKGCGFLEAVYQECLGIVPKLEYERIAKTQQIRKKTEISDASFEFIRVHSRDSRARKIAW